MCQSFYICTNWMSLQYSHTKFQTILHVTLFKRLQISKVSYRVANLSTEQIGNESTDIPAYSVQFNLIQFTVPLQSRLSVGALQELLTLTTEWATVEGEGEIEVWREKQIENDCLIHNNDFCYISSSRWEFEIRWFGSGSWQHSAKTIRPCLLHCICFPDNINRGINDTKHTNYTICGINCRITF